VRAYPATIVVLENKLVLELGCVCIPSYAACHERAPYCPVLPVTIQHFPHQMTSMNKENLLNTNSVFLFPVQLLCEIFFILRRIK
jgi:hypothetical protein